MSCNVPLFDVDILKNPDTERVMKLLGVMQCTTPRSTVIYKVEHKKIDEYCNETTSCGSLSGWTD